MGSASEQPQAVLSNDKKIILSAEKTTLANECGFFFRGLFTPCVSLSK